jgi:hypothetical protein
MSHLSLETIARLVDEAPDAAEKAHLESCDACSSGLETMRADLAALASLPGIQPPAEEWPAIEAQLAREGLLVLPRFRFSWRMAALRAAAAIVIFLLGGAAGMAWRGDEAGEQVAGTRDQYQPGDIVPATDRPGTLERALVSGRMPSTRDGAARYLTEAEALYLDAVTRMAALSAGEDLGDPYTRLAALEIIAAATREALGQAPADPVLNGYHITAIANREALLRQIAAKKTRAGWF